MTNHNQLPNTTQAELSTEEEDVFTIAGAEAWRAHRQALINDQLAELATQGTIVDESIMNSLGSVADVAIDQYLVGSGLEPTTSNYNEIRENFLLAGRITDSAWNYSAASRGEQGDMPSGRDMFSQLVDERTAGSSEQESSSTEIPTERTREEWEEYAADYEEYANLLTNRDKWATESAIRQGRGLSLKSEKRDVIKDKYHESVRAFGIKELEGQLSDSDSDTEKNAKVIAWLFEEQAKLRELTTEKLKSTKTSKFVEWMNRGNTWQKIGKSALVGVAASGAAAGISLVAGFGLVAGVAGGATAGAVGFGRFVRGFARGDRQRGMKTAQESFIDEDRPIELEDTENDSLSKRFDDAAVHYNEAFEDDTKLEQKKRRKAVVRGLTNVALGVGVGAAVHYASDFFEGDNTHTPNGDTSTEDGDRKPWSERDADGDGTPNGQDAAPHNPDVTDVTHGRGELFDGSMGTRSLTPEAIDLMHEQLNGYTVKPGDSVWSLSESFLQDQGIKHPTVYEIDTTKDVLLKELRAEGFADVRGWLSAGDTLRIK